MGPLSGIKVVELAGIGPAPYTAMLLADLGADVVKVDRSGNVTGADPAVPPSDITGRGRRSIGVDLKNPDGVATRSAFWVQRRASQEIHGFTAGERSPKD